MKQSEFINFSDINLNPDDCNLHRKFAHQAVDAMIDRLHVIREFPAWKNAPDDVRDALNTEFPIEGVGIKLFMKCLRE